MTTPAGERSALVRFERPNLGRSRAGVQKPLGWQPIQKAWAKVRFGTSAERREAATESASQVATFRVVTTAALRGVTTADRILFDPAGGPLEGAGAIEWDITGIAAVGSGDIEFTAVARRD